MALLPAPLVPVATRIRPGRLATPSRAFYGGFVKSSAEADSRLSTALRDLSSCRWTNTEFQRLLATHPGALRREFALGARASGNG